MKSRIFVKSLVVVAITGLITTGTFTAKAQPGPRWADKGVQEQGYYCRIPNLTDDQQKKLNDLRTKHLKEVTPLKNELNEKVARLRTLESADKQDIDAINKTIDDISALKAKLMKKRVSHRAEVSQILTDDQKVYFNAQGGQRGMGQGFGKGMGYGRHRMNRGGGFPNCPMSN